MRGFLVISYDGNNMDPWKTVYNTDMSKNRITVECYFKEVKQLWSVAG